MGEKQPEIYSAMTQVNDGTYHTIKVIRRLSKVEFYVDGIAVNLKAETSKLMKRIERNSFLLFLSSS